MCQLLVQIVEHVRVFLVVANAFEQGRALRDDLAILDQRRAVARLHLAERAVEETAPFFRRAIDQVQVGGCEEHDLHLPDDFHVFGVARH